MKMCGFGAFHHGRCNLSKPTFPESLAGSDSELGKSLKSLHHNRERGLRSYLPRFREKYI